MQILIAIKGKFQAETLLFSCFLALPLLYLPELPSKARWLRFIVLTCVIGLAVLYAGFQYLKGKHGRRRQRPTVVGALIFLLVFAMIITWLVNVVSTRPVAYIGTEPEFLGYIAWGVCLCAGILFRNSAQAQLLSAKNVFVVLPVLCVSLLYGSFYIFHGLKLPGLTYSPVAMATYANLAVVLCLHWLRRSSEIHRTRWLVWLTFVLAILTVLFCQTRLGIIVLVSNLIVWAFYGIRAHSLWRGSLLAIVAIIIALPFAYAQFFAGFRAESVGDGLTYKTSLYGDTIKNMATQHLIYGKGPSTLPRTINNQNYVPIDVMQSLNVSQRFSANHDLFFDFSYFFGLLSGLILLLTTGAAVGVYMQNKQKFNLAYLLLFLTLLASALFTMPSLELTPLYFVVLLSLFASTNRRQSGKPVTKDKL